MEIIMSNACKLPMQLPFKVKKYSFSKKNRLGYTRWALSIIVILVRAKYGASCHILHSFSKLLKLKSMQVVW